MTTIKDYWGDTITIHRHAGSELWIEVAQENVSPSRRAIVAGIPADSLRTAIDKIDPPATTASPRPLTADDITDEMVERARDAWGRSCSNGPAVFRRVLVEALTAPTRPEGAEELEDHLSNFGYLHDETGASRVDLATLANDLAVSVLDPTVKEN